MPQTDSPKTLMHLPVLPSFTLKGAHLPHSSIPTEDTTLYQESGSRGSVGSALDSKSRGPGFDTRHGQKEIGSFFHSPHPPLFTKQYNLGLES